MEKRIVWQPVLGVGGVLIGIILDREFALKCQSLSVNDEFKKRCLDYVWSITKPSGWNKGYTPSNLIWWDKGTLLPTMFQAYTDMGKWLEFVSSSPQRDVIVYSFHHGDMPGDEAANRWLQFLFSRWVQFMWLEFEKRKESG